MSKPCVIVFRGNVEARAEADPEGDDYVFPGMLKIGGVAVCERVNEKFYHGHKETPETVTVAVYMGASAPCLDAQGEVYAWAHDYGYSEYTPGSEGSLRVGKRDIENEIAENYDGKEITLIVSNQPINLLELPEQEKP